DRRGEDPATLDHLTDRSRELLRWRRLEQEPARPSAQRAKDVVVDVIHRQHDHASLGARGDECGEALEPVGPRHLNIHEDDVGRGLACYPRGREPVVGLADDLEITRGVHDGAQAGADEVLVVRDDDADHDSSAVAPLSSGSRTSRTKLPSPAVPAVKVPPLARARSRSPARPNPAPCAGEGPDMRLLTRTT